MAASGHERARLEDAVGVVARAVLAVHAAQDAVRAGLQRRMDVRGDARRFGHQAQQVVGEIHGFDRAEPQALHLGFGEQHGAADPPGASGCPARGPSGPG